MGGVGKGQGMPTQAVWAQGGYVTLFQKMPTQKPLIRKFQNHVFLNAYANVYQMHTISFPVYFSKVRYSSEAVCYVFLCALSTRLIKKVQNCGITTTFGITFKKNYIFLRIVFDIFLCRWSQPQLDFLSSCEKIWRVFLRDFCCNKLLEQS